MTGEAGGDDEARHAVDGRNDRYRVRHDIDQAGPFLDDLGGGESREHLCQLLVRLAQIFAIGRRIKHAGLLVGRFTVERHRLRLVEFLPEAVIEGRHFLGQVIKGAAEFELLGRDVGGTVS